MSTNTLNALFDRLRNQDVTLWAADGALRYRAPKGVMTPDLKAELAQRKEEILALLSGPQTAIIPRLETADDYPVSHAQRRMWILAHDEASAAAYNIPLALSLEGPLDRFAFEQALDALVRRHESLRTTIVSRDGEPRQRVRENVSIPVRFVDLTQEAEVEERITKLATTEALRQFDLANGPLLRATLLKLAETRHVLLLTLHHIICDGWSLSIMVRDFSALYEHVRNATPDPLPYLPFQYRDYSSWHNNLFQQGGAEIHRSYWLQQLKKPLPILNLPTDFPHPPLQSFNGAGVSCKLDRDRTEQLHALCRKQGASLFMGLTAVVKVLLYRYTDQEDIMVGTPIAGRINAGLTDQIGLYLNTIVLRDQVQSDMRFDEFLRQVTQTATEAYDHQIYPFDLLVDELNLPRDVSRSPLFDVNIILQNNDLSTASIGAMKISHLPQQVHVSKFDITFDFVEREDGLHLGIEFNTDLFLEDRIRRMAAHFEELVNSVLENPQQRIGLLRLMPDAERTALVHGFNKTEAHDHDTYTLIDLFESQVKRAGDAVAVTYEGTSLTYEELNRRANQLARHLRARGVGAEVPVGIYLGRSPNLLVGLLGVLKAGGLYVPLDPAYPKERLNFMVTDAGLSLMITEESLKDGAPAQGLPRVCLDTDWSEIQANTGENLAPQTSPDNAAYTIYTSGSSGRPKGVQISHAALVNLLISTSIEPGLNPSDVLLAVTTVSFDIAALELYLPLITGARLMLAPARTASDGSLLLALLNESRATVMQATPATWQLLIDSGWRGSPNLKILCGGEALPTEMAKTLIEKGASVWNMYGPTETTIWSAVDEVKLSDTLIGPPLRNTRFYVLDRSLQLVPMGIPGELHIGGLGLARGYAGQAALTAERFIPNPLGAGDRLYKTGDLVTSRADGRLRFLGRIDNQIKIRGYRVELGEIEAALGRYPAVLQCVAAVREDASGTQQLVAYVVPNGAFSIIEVRSFLEETLPRYMIPSAFVVLDAMPLSPAGKVDRRALPVPDATAAQTPYVAPRTDTERTLAAVWQDVLKLDSIGIHDNFFEIGGNSLKAARATFLIAGALRVNLTLADLFREPTVEGLATIAATKRKRTELPIPRLQDIPEAIGAGSRSRSAAE